MNAPTERAAFLAERKQGLGGSDIAAALGYSKYKTPVALWMEKTGQSDDDIDSMRMRFGNHNEEFVAREYCEVTGLKVQRFNPMLRHRDHPHVIGHVDRLVVPRGAKVAAHRGEIRTDRGLEAKTVDGHVYRYSGEWGEPGTDEIPTYYLIQCVTYMALTGCQYWDLAALIGSGSAPLAIYPLQRDAELEDEILRRAEEWWKRHVIGGEAPAPTNEADIDLLYPQAAKRDPITAEEYIESAIRRLAKVKRISRRLEQYEGDLKSTIKAYMQSAGTLLDADGNKLATWNNRKGRTTFDLDGFVGHLCPGAMPDERAEFIADAKRSFTTRGPDGRTFLIK